MPTVAQMTVPGNTEIPLTDSWVDMSTSLSYICFTGSRPVNSDNWAVRFHHNQTNVTFFFKIKNYNVK